MNIVIAVAIGASYGALMFQFFRLLEKNAQLANLARSILADREAVSTQFMAALRVVAQYDVNALLRIVRMNPELRPFVDAELQRTEKQHVPN